MSEASFEHEVDYIVVGGGSAGCIVAARLASESAASVLLLEFGEHGEDNPETLIVDGYKQAFINDRVMWPKNSTPQPGCLGKSLFVGSGRGLGGSGAINAMVYLRSSVADFADWGVDAWRWSEVVGDYEGMERVLDPHRRPPTAFTDACVAAAEQAGFRHEEDLNAGDLDGVLGHEWMNYRGEERRSSYVAFLKPALDRPNLRVETEARARRVIFAGDRRAIGVEYERRGQVVRVRARREVILCAGAVESAKLLKLSGLGPAAELRRHGLPVVRDSPEIGENFQDHPNIALFYLGRNEVDAKYPQLYGFHRANTESELPPGQPDTCYVFYPARSSLREMVMRMLPTMILPAQLRDRSPLPEGIRGAVSLAFRSRQLQRLVERIYGMIVILGKPKSRGQVTLGGPRPSDDPRIDPAYFSDPEDLETLVRGIELARRVTGAPALRAWGSRELLPGRALRSRRVLEGFIRANAMTTYHFAGTARMGEDASSVVDPQLKVRGVEGLRVADASVIPAVPVSALNAPSMLIGYRAASMILGED
ncbi:GMC family oxidoreductase [Pseudenhygromyxa sp. WMMC2535]|uniref:GMC family oxidoreductase n=1 Tax=Pseudenhygromyxa sp. WMMC2535 TaxID=2712867 RepID=UPI00155748AC|nr:GMC family oxidoreductase [Pseudenhygromyxa sp. WMMC2535]NVB39699.1 GMC family oxidoreductase [Pseudenhygromyxa sp. WMMC2535]